MRHSAKLGPVDGGKRSNVLGEVDGFLLTIITPTYNRAHTLHRAFDSLMQQGGGSFEWLVVDNGSTDNTPDLVAAFAQQAPFPIRYVRRKDGGKGAAVNAGVVLARGRLVSVLDSDDAFTPDAVQIISEEWQALSPGEQERLAGLGFPSVDELGQPACGAFPAPRLVSNALEMEFRYKVRGERHWAVRQDVLVRYPFAATTEAGSHIPETVTSSRLALDYQSMFVDRVTRIYYLHDGIARISQPGKSTKNYLGKCEWMRTRLTLELPWFRFAPATFWRAAVEYVRCALHCGRSLRVQVAALPSVPARLLWAVAVPFGWVRYRMDRRRQRD